MEMTLFANRFIELMTDPAYKSGVDPISIAKTVQDILGVFKGSSEYVSLPLPIDGSPPQVFMEFRDENNDVPAPLNVGVQSPSSRRTMSYNLKHCIEASTNRIITDIGFDDNADHYEDDEIPLDHDQMNVRISQIAAMATAKPSRRRGHKV